ncbi:MAG TPA: transposase, partial [Alloacidobacterium sp.]|nr:transposase [Alloacidobacterium sp.]
MTVAETVAGGSLFHCLDCALSGNSFCGSIRENTFITASSLGWTYRAETLVDRELYLPQQWAEDRERCRAAGIPAEVHFQTKPMLGRQMLERAFQAGVPCGWVAGDEVYSRD